MYLRPSLLCTSLLLTACPKKDADLPVSPALQATPTTGAPVSHADTEPDATASLAEGLLKTLNLQTILLDPGEEPRSSLSFALEPARLDWGMTLVNGVQIDIDLPTGETQTQTLSTPPVTLHYQTTLVPGPDEGTFRHGTTFRDVTVDAAEDDPTASVLSQQYAFLTGFDFGQIMTPDGTVIGIDVDTSLPGVEQLALVMTDQLKNHRVPFPAEPVGNGGSWKTETSANMSGMAVAVSTTYTLVDRRDAEAEVSLSSVVSLTGDMQLPGLPPEAKLVVEAFNITGEGTMTLDLTTMASEGDLKMGGDIKMGMTGPDGSAIGMAMRMAMDITLTVNESADTDN